MLKLFLKQCFPNVDKDVIYISKGQENYITKKGLFFFFLLILINGLLLLVDLESYQTDIMPKSQSLRFFKIQVYFDRQLQKKAVVLAVWAFLWYDIVHALLVKVVESPKWTHCRGIVITTEEWDPGWGLVLWNFLLFHRLTGLFMWTRTRGVHTQSSGFEIKKKDRWKERVRAIREREKLSGFETAIMTPLMITCVDSKSVAHAPIDIWINMIRFPWDGSIKHSTQVQLHKHIWTHTHQHSADYTELKLRVLWVELTAAVGECRVNTDESDISDKLIRPYKLCIYLRILSREHFSMFYYKMNMF